MREKETAGAGANQTPTGKPNRKSILRRLWPWRKRSHMADLWQLTADLMIVIADVRVMLETNRAELGRLADRLEHLETQVWEQTQQEAEK